MTIQRKRVLTELIVFLVVFVLVYTASDKLFHLERFRYNLATGPLTHALSPVAWVLPALELTISLLLTFPGARRVGFFAAAALFLLFTAYVGWMLLSGTPLPCPCGGLFYALSWPQHLLLDALLAAVSLLGWQWQSRLETERKPGVPPPAVA